MLSRPSFKTVLIAFRDSLYAPRKPGAIGNRNSADLDTLDRWIKDERGEAIWRNLKKQRPDADASAFIRTILTARRSTAATINRTASFKAEWKAALPKLKKRLSKLDGSRGPLEVANTLEAAAERLREMHRFHFGFADQANFDLSRKDQGGSRARKLFMQIVGNILVDQFGRRFDDDVATLAEIALAQGVEIQGSC
jgi:hypothetical protein